MHAMKWIPVTEELPDKPDEYLVTMKTQHILYSPVRPYESTVLYQRETIKAYYCKKVWSLDGGRTDITDVVTAWMPLPRPYYDGDD